MDVLKPIIGKGEPVTRFGRTAIVWSEMAVRAAVLRALRGHARPLDEWHDDIGNVLWWKFPIDEPPYCGTPLDIEWPGYHTHWTVFAVPDCPA